MYSSILGYVGVLTSAIKCTLTAKRTTQNRLIWFIVTVLSILGGGSVICDLAVLGTKPTILDSPCKILLTLTIVIMMTATPLYRDKNLSPNHSPSVKMSKVIEKLLIVADSIGVLASAAIGYEHGIEVNGSPFVATVCGWITAVGGGILPAIVISTQVNMTFTNKFKWLKAELIHSIPYYAFGLTTTMVYGVAAMAVGKELAIIGLTPFTVFMGIFTHKRIEA